MPERDALRAPLAAVSFLTVLPVARRVPLDADDVRRGGVLFPLVGAAVGLIVGGVAVLLARVVTPVPAAAVAVAAGAIVTGGLHLDGLADAADGLGGRSRGDALRIMREHSIGAFGVVALVLDLLVKVTAIASLAGASAALGPLIAAGAASRAVCPALAAALPYAQSEPGTGAALSGRRTPVPAAAAAVLAFAIAAVAAGGTGLWMCAAVVAVGLAVGLAARLRLGGVTGDVMGAAAELCETTALVVAAALV